MNINAVFGQNFFVLPYQQASHALTSLSGCTGSSRAPISRASLARCRRHLLRASSDAGAAGLVPDQDTGTNHQPVIITLLSSAYVYIIYLSRPWNILSL